MAFVNILVLFHIHVCWSLRLMPPKKRFAKGSLPSLPANWHLPPPEQVPIYEASVNISNSGRLAIANSVTGSTASSSATSSTSGTSSSSSSSGLKIASRKDAPLTKEYTRGSLALALASAEGKDSTIEEFEKKVYANSSHSTRASHLKTWSICHEKWFGKTIPMIPLTVVSIQAVMAMLVKGGYRSADAYLSRAKDLHMENHDWSSQLARAQKRAGAAARRGRGPSHQAGEFPLDQAAPLAHELESQVPQPSPFGSLGFPLNFEAYVVCACFFILREIECSLILVKSLTIDLINLKITILLPVSKTDPEAVSCSRSWSCVCGDRVHARCRPCPVHSLIEHMEILEAYFGSPLPEDLPLFPDVDGGTSEKHMIAQGLEVILGKLNIPIVGADGRPAFGGHSFRVTGSRMLARRGIPIEVIMILARWQSSVILRYIQSAPLQALAQLYKATDVEAQDEPKRRKVKAIADDSPQFSEDQIKVAISSAETAKEAADRLENQINSLRDKVSELQSQAIPCFIINNSCLGCIHAVGTDYVRETPDLWKSRCGWKYSGSRFSRVASVQGIDPERLCDKCFPQ